MCYRKRQCNDAGLTEVGGARGLYLNVGEVGLRRRKEKEKGSMRTGHKIFHGRDLVYIGGFTVY
jgi:hypothetical protein